jgi:hypothetical protein
MALELVNFMVCGHASLDDHQQLNIMGGGIQFIRAPSYPMRTAPMYFVSSIRINELDDIGETPDIRIEMVLPNNSIDVMFTAVGGGNWDLSNSIVPDMPFAVHDLIPFTVEIAEPGIYTFRTIWEEGVVGSWTIHFE